MITFVVRGQPKPKGSMRHVGHGRMVEQVAGSKPWREAVKWAALAATDGAPVPITGPVAVDITYTVPKPTSAPKRRRTWPVTRTSGDVDKVSRNCLDALVDAGLIRDDSQVVTLAVRKAYPGEAEHALDGPGARITLTPLDPAPEGQP